MNNHKTICNIKTLIKGKNKLSGSVRITGAKNAALPELAAAILSPGEFEFSNVPQVEDIKVMYQALQNLGAKGEFFDHRVKIQIPKIESGLVPREIVETSRASVLILGPLLARNGYAKVSEPGRCSIGDHKINFHLDGLHKMGAEIQVDKDHIIAKAKLPLKGIDFTFPGVTVTGTENLLMAAALAQGTTILRNCALEPEIGDLIDLLIAMGVDIQGKDSPTVTIKGKGELHGARHTVIPDRIEMGTYVIAGAFAGHHISVENVVPQYIRSLLDILEKMGVTLEVSDDRISVCSNGDLLPVDVETLPYPGFPTDLQAQLTTLLTQADGLSHMKENIFNNRFQHALELNKLGANIEICGDTACIRGRTPLQGQVLRATDLRASAALVLGGLIAEGETVVENSYQLLRGYENMPQKLQQLGAEIELLNEPSSQVN